MKRTSPSATLAELTRIALHFRDEREWKQFHNPKDLAITLMLEAAELLEHTQWKNGRQLLRDLRERRQDVADELADVLHVLVLLAAEMDIDLTEAFKRKMSKNAAKYPVEKARGTARKYTEL